MASDEIKEKDSIDSNSDDQGGFGLSSFKLNQKQAKMRKNAAMQYKKLENVAENRKRDFRQRIKNLAPEIRPIIKALSKDHIERSKEEVDMLLNYFCQVPVFSQLKISSVDLLKGVSMIESLFVPKATILFQQNDPGINFYIVIAGQC